MHQQEVFVIYLLLNAAASVSIIKGSTYRFIMMSISCRQNNQDIGPHNIVCGLHIQRNDTKSC